MPLHFDTGFNRWNPDAKDNYTDEEAIIADTMNLTDPDVETKPCDCGCGNVAAQGSSMTWLCWRNKIVLPERAQQAAEKISVG